MSGPGTPRSGDVGHVWVDGRLLPADGRHLSVFDRGFQLGDGVFETLRVRGGHPTELAEHVARLRRSAAGLDIAAARRPRRDAWSTASPTLLAADGLDGPTGDASVRITVSRGPFRGRGLLPPDEVVAADHRDPGLARRAAARPTISSAASTSSRRPSGATRPNPLVTLKTTSRADYVYARLEARRAGADDALFLTVDGHLSEGTTANIFLVRRSPTDGRELATPSLDCAILPGTTRSWLPGVGRAGRPAAGRGPARPRRPRRRRRGVPVLERRRGPAGDPVRGRADRRRPARTVDAARAGGSRGDDPGRRGRRMTRDELIAATRQLVDEGDRLRAEPVAGLAPGLAPALGRPARHGVGQHGPLPPRLADGRQAEGHRPRPADDAPTRRPPTSARSPSRRRPRSG